MGRHGGGSRSGGSSGSRSSGGSRRGGSSSRSSSTPFRGGYNRSYYDRRGRYHSYYTTNRSFGTRGGWSAGIVVALIFVTVHMCMMLAGMLSTSVFLGKKVDGDVNRIFIEDRANILNSTQEKEIIELFEKVYDKSGMPVTLYTDDFSWKSNYYSLEAYSEELYYKISFDEDAMLILFTTEDLDGFVDWEYDMYCGDDTIKCFSDESFDQLLENFQKAMSRQDLTEALDYAWNSVIADLAEVKIGSEAVITTIILLAFYSIFYIAIFSGVKKQNEAYRYFRNNPGELSSDTWSSEVVSPNPVPSYGYPSSGNSTSEYSSTGYSSTGNSVSGTSSGNVTSMNRMYSKTCNFCGISNDGTEQVCSFCGALLNENGK
ncbi:MAG: TPM domain-containing protein [Lachnospiraceae bacterium]|nr:TPM domain-containing protein [Lachnospiraceae bacterium]